MEEDEFWGSLREGEAYHLLLNDVASGGTKSFLIIPKVRKNGLGEQSFLKLKLNSFSFS